MPQKWGGNHVKLTCNGLRAALWTAMPLTFLLKKDSPSHLYRSTYVYMYLYVFIYTHRHAYVHRDMCAHPYMHTYTIYEMIIWAWGKLWKMTSWVVNMVPGEGVGRRCAQYHEGGANKSLAFNHTTAYYLSVTNNRETSEN